MKKLINIIICILIIAVIVIVAIIGIEYYKRYKNESKMDSIVNYIENIDEEIKQDVSNDKIIVVDGFMVEGIVEIPAISIKYPIVADTSDEAMEVAIIKYWGKGINEIGNYSIAGHNYKNGTMFGKTKYLKLGDKIILTDLKGNSVEYEIYKIFNVDPNDVSILEDSNKVIKEVTLITCTNGHKQRLTIKAKEII